MQGDKKDKKNKGVLLATEHPPAQQQIIQQQQLQQQQIQRKELLQQAETLTPEQVAAMKREAELDTIWHPERSPRKSAEPTYRTYVPTYVPTYIPTCTGHTRTCRCTLEGVRVERKISISYLITCRYEEMLEAMTPAERQMLEDQENDLDAMTSVLADLKQISARTNTELHSQSKKIDGLHVCWREGCG